MGEVRAKKEVFVVGNDGADGADSVESFDGVVSVSTRKMRTTAEAFLVSAKARMNGMITKMKWMIMKVMMRLTAMIMIMMVMIKRIARMRRRPTR